MLADISLSTEAAVAVGALLASMCGAVTYLFKRLLDEKDAQLQSYKEMAELAVTNLEQAARNYLKAAGKPMVDKLAPIIPEHNSPSTKRQTETAEIQTLRARLVASTLALDLPARTATNGNK